MNFIEIYDDALSSENCDKLIDYFNKSPQGEGMVGDYKVDYTQKKSTDLVDSKFSLHPFTFQLISSTLQEYTDKYVKKYIPLQNMDKWGVDDVFTLIKFEGEDGGYKAWHTEHSKSVPYRILVWMFYLNDAQCGTEFLYHPNVESKIDFFISSKSHSISSEFES